MKKAIKIFDGIISVVMLFIFTFVAVGNLILPSQITSVGGSGQRLNSFYTVDLKDSNKRNVPVNSAQQPANAEIKLFGAIPVKSARVVDSQRKYVVPGGESFGIKLHTNGVIVVGVSGVTTERGTVNPAQEAGIAVGDIITEIEGEAVNTTEEVQSKFADCCGKTLGVKIKHDDKYINTAITPVIASGTEDYKAGIWVRDSTAGVGTVTFYNPANKSFAGLGHPINDVDTNELMPLLSGEAVKANVTGVYKGLAGEAGSLCCTFTNDAVGELVSNIEDGIYGKYKIKVDESHAMPVATCQEVQKGEAQILSTVDAQTSKLYSVEIERINYSGGASSKNLVIRVTDPELLAKTGGIVQGMSGSPIIQNGMIVGAVTHVFINSPDKGYGIFAEKMVQTSENIK